VEEDPCQGEDKRELTLKNTSPERKKKKEEWLF